MTNEIQKILEQNNISNIDILRAYCSEKYIYVFNIKDISKCTTNQNRYSYIVDRETHIALQGSLNTDWVQRYVNDINLYTGFKTER